MVSYIKTVLYHGTRETHPELEQADFDKLSRLPLVKIAEAYNRDIGVEEVNPEQAKGETSSGE